MARDRSNTTLIPFKPSQRRSRSMSEVLAAIKTTSDETITNIHTSLLASPTPPSLPEVRARRDSIKQTRRDLISNVIRPRTTSRAAELAARPREDFVSESGYLHAAFTAMDVLSRVGELDEKARCGTCGEVKMEGGEDCVAAKEDTLAPILSSEDLKSLDDANIKVGNSNLHH